MNMDVLLVEQPDFNRPITKMERGGRTYCVRDVSTSLEIGQKDLSTPTPTPPFLKIFLCVCVLHVN